MPPEQLTLEWFGKNYRFTEEQTLSEMSLDALMWWPVIAHARAEAMRMEQEREARMARNSSRRRM
jgi:hypothetical protein